MFKKYSFKFKSGKKQATFFIFKKSSLFFVLYFVSMNYLETGIVNSCPILIAAGFVIPFNL